MLNAIKIFILLFSFLLVGCNNGKKAQQETESYKILSELIDKMAKPLFVAPPPPPKGVRDSLKNARDSILKIIETETWQSQKNIVAVYPYFFGTTQKLNTDDPFLDEYISLAKELSNDSSDIPIDIKKIEPTRGNIFIEAPSVNELVKNKALWDTFDIKISCSKIVFDKKYSKALVIIGVSRAPLNSFSYLFFMEKKDNLWSIKYKKALTIS